MSGESKPHELWRELNMTIAIVAFGVLAAAAFIIPKVRETKVQVGPLVLSVVKDGVTEKAGTIEELYWVEGQAKRQKDMMNIMWAYCDAKSVAISGSCILHPPYNEHPVLQNMGAVGNGWHCTWNQNLTGTEQQHNTDAAVLCARLHGQQ
jgi:hypothetical protein